VREDGKKSRLRRRGGAIVGAVLLGSLTLVAVTPLPADAAFTTSAACKFNHYPNAPGGASALQVACQVAVGAAGGFQQVDDLYAGLPPTGDATKKGVVGAVWHYGAARVVTDGATTNLSTTVTSASAHFSSADINHVVTGAGIPVRTFIASVTNATTVVLNRAATATASGVTLTIENTDARSVTDGSISGTTVTSATAKFRTEDIGRNISGTNIPHATTITGVTNATTATMSASGTAGSGQEITIGTTSDISSARQVADGSSTNGSTTIKSATANFKDTDINLPVSGFGIPASDYVTAVFPQVLSVAIGGATYAGATNSGTYSYTTTRPHGLSVGDTISTAGFLPTKYNTSPTKIYSVSATPSATTFEITGAGTNPATVLSDPGSANTQAGKVYKANSSATLNAAATATTSSGNWTIGQPNATAPEDGEPVATFQSEINLNPALVTGSDPCSAETADSGTITGTWYNAGNFQTLTFGAYPSASVTASGAAVGQIVFPTSIITFGGYTTVDPNGRYHFVMPSLPTSLALCPEVIAPGSDDIPGISTAFGFTSRTNAQQNQPTGTGAPGTSIVRGLNDLNLGTLGQKPCVPGFGSDGVTPIAGGTGICLTYKSGILIAGGNTVPSVAKSAGCVISWPNYPDFKCGDA
jgi:hypothetical protein